MSQTTTPLDSRIVANAVLERADARGHAVTNLDVQKIVYFLHGHFLKLHHMPLVAGEFEAWPYGPVHRVLYDAFKKYNDIPIEGRATAFDPVRRATKALPALDNPDVLALLNEVLDFYLDMPTHLLVQITHDTGTPWSRTVDESKRKVNIGMRIADSLIEQYFEGPYLAVN